MQEALAAVPNVVEVLHRRTLLVREEEILLVVASTEQVKQLGLRVIADCFKDHVVSAGDGQITHVLHRLHKGERTTVSFAGFFLEVRCQRVLHINIVRSPELHAENPRHQEFW